MFLFIFFIVYFYIWLFNPSVWHWVMDAYSHSIWEQKAGGPRASAHLSLHGKFKAGLGYMKFYL